MPGDLIGMLPTRTLSTGASFTEYKIGNRRSGKNDSTNNDPPPKSHIVTLSGRQPLVDQNQTLSQQYLATFLLLDSDISPVYYLRS